MWSHKPYNLATATGSDVTGDLFARRRVLTEPERMKQLVDQSYRGLLRVLALGKGELRADGDKDAAVLARGERAPALAGRSIDAVVKIDRLQVRGPGPTQVVETL